MWSEDCSERIILSGYLDLEDSSDNSTNFLQLIRTNGEVIREVCPYRFGLNGTPRYQGFRHLTSYDPYINVCQLRLDLDADNSGSRFGPHYWEDPPCASLFRVADEDVRLSSQVGPLDSITVRLRTAGSQIGFDKFRFPITNRLEVRNFGDTLLHLVKNELTTDEDLTEYLSTVRLETTAPVVHPGERIVEVYAYAGGLRSDQARAFIQVLPDVGSAAGQSTEVVVCPGGEANLFEALGPGALTGGSWSPALSPSGTWRERDRDYGTWRYVARRDGCPADTAFVTVAPPTPAADYLPVADTTIELCPGATFTWNVDHPRVSSVRWDDGTTSRTRLLTEPGFYTGTINDNGGCRTDLVSLQILAAPPAYPMTSDTTEVCQGESIRLADGTLLTRDTSIQTVFARSPLCDSLHETYYRFLPAPRTARFERICQGDSLIIGDTILTTAGTYLLPENSTEECSATVELDLRVSHPDTIFIDTVLQTGTSFQIANRSFSEPGTYEFFIPSNKDCGQQIFLMLDFTSSVYQLAASDYIWTPTLLRRGLDRLQFYRKNSIHSVEINRLLIYDSQGRQIHSSRVSEASWLPTTAVAPGIYFYRAELSVDRRVLLAIGRVTVID